MISFIETILGTVLSSFVIVIISTFMALLVDFLFPFVYKMDEDDFDFYCGNGRFATRI